MTVAPATPVDPTEGRQRRRDGLVAARTAERRQRLALLVTVDAAGAAAVYAAAGWLLASTSAGELVSAGLPIALIAPLTLLASGCYPSLPAGPGDSPASAKALVVASSATTWLFWLGGAAIALQPARPELLTTWLALPVCWAANRALIARLGSRPPEERVLVVGSGDAARRVVDIYGRERASGLVVVGLVEDDPTDQAEGGPPVIGRVDDLPRLLDEDRADRVVVAFSRRRDSEVAQILRDCEDPRVPVDVVPRLFDVVGSELVVRPVGGLPLVAAEPTSLSTLAAATKRVLDIAVAAVLLVLTAPVLAAIACAIVADDGRPILFRQLRVGRHGRQFVILKFRTMVREADATGVELEAAIADANGGVAEDVPRLVDALKQTTASRLTRTGAFLRRTSLDELPQLWNVLIGDMSLVGPRPLRPFEVATLDRWQQTRHLVRPGLTGLWQIVGRSDVGWSERMQLDCSYVRQWSLASDLRILAKTPRVVLKGRGAL